MKEKHGHVYRVLASFCLLAGGLVLLLISTWVCFGLFSVLEEAELGKRAWLIVGGLYMCDVLAIGLLFSLIRTRNKQKER
jgi:hypothetical protein